MSTQPTNRMSLDSYTSYEQSVFISRGFHWDHKFNEWTRLFDEMPEAVFRRQGNTNLILEEYNWDFSKCDYVAIKREFISIDEFISVDQ